VSHDYFKYRHQHFPAFSSIFQLFNQLTQQKVILISKKTQHNPAIFVGQKPQPGAMRLDGLFQLQGDSEVPM